MVPPLYERSLSCFRGHIDCLVCNLCMTKFQFVFEDHPQDLYDLNVNVPKVDKNNIVTPSIIFASCMMVVHFRYSKCYSGVYSMLLLMSNSTGMCFSPHFIMHILKSYIFSFTSELKLLKRVQTQKTKDQMSIFFFLLLFGQKNMHTPLTSFLKHKSSNIFYSHLWIITNNGSFLPNESHISFFIIENLSKSI